MRVVDPLRVPDTQFEVWFQDSTAGNLDDAYWFIVNLSTGDTVWSDRAIDVKYEQLLLDWGISVSIGQANYTGTGAEQFTTPEGNGSISYADPSKA